MNCKVCGTPMFRRPNGRWRCRLCDQAYKRAARVAKAVEKAARYTDGDRLDKEAAEWLSARGF